MNISLTQEQKKVLKNHYKQVVLHWPQKYEYCEVCLIKEGMDLDVLIFCELCEGLIHQSCYGSELLESIPENEWYCERCRILIDEYLEKGTLHEEGKCRCYYCPEQKGILKQLTLQQSDKQVWAHLGCVASIKSLGFTDTSLTTIVLKSSPSRVTDECRICQQKVGNCGYNRMQFYFPLFMCQKTWYHLGCNENEHSHGMSYNKKEPDHHIVFCEEHLYQLRYLEFPDDKFLKDFIKEMYKQRQIFDNEGDNLSSILKDYPQCEGINYVQKDLLEKYSQLYHQMKENNKKIKKNNNSQPQLGTNSLSNHSRSRSRSPKQDKYLKKKKTHSSSNHSSDIEAPKKSTSKSSVSRSKLLKEETLTPQKSKIKCDESEKGKKLPVAEKKSNRIAEKLSMNLISEAKLLNVTLAKNSEIMAIEMNGSDLKQKTGKETDTNLEIEKDDKSTKSIDQVEMEKEESAAQEIRTIEERKGSKCRQTNDTIGSSRKVKQQDNYQNRLKTSKQSDQNDSCSKKNAIENSSYIEGRDSEDGLNQKEQGNSVVKSSVTVQASNNNKEKQNLNGQVSQPLTTTMIILTPQGSQKKHQKKNGQVFESQQVAEGAEHPDNWQYIQKVLRKFNSYENVDKNSETNFTIPMHLLEKLSVKKTVQNEDADKLEEASSELQDNIGKDERQRICKQFIGEFVRTNVEKLTGCVQMFILHPEMMKIIQIDKALSQQQWKREIAQFFVHKECLNPIVKEVQISRCINQNIIDIFEDRGLPQCIPVLKFFKLFKQNFLIKVFDPISPIREFEQDHEYSLPQTNQAQNDSKIIEEVNGAEQKTIVVEIYPIESNQVPNIIETNEISSILDAKEIPNHDSEIIIEGMNMDQNEINPRNTCGEVIFEEISPQDQTTSI